MLNTKTITLATRILGCVNTCVVECWELRTELWYTRNLPCSHKIAITFTPHITVSLLNALFSNLLHIFKFEYKFAGSGHDPPSPSLWKLLDSMVRPYIVLYLIDLSGDANRFCIGIVSISTTKIIKNKNRKKKNRKETRVNSNNKNNSIQFWPEDRNDKLRKKKAENRTRLFSMTRLLFGRARVNSKTSTTANGKPRKGRAEKKSKLAKSSRLMPRPPLLLACCCWPAAAVAAMATTAADGSNCCLFSLCTSISRYNRSIILLSALILFSFFFSFIH